MRRLRNQLRAGQSTCGMWVTMESPTVTEVAAAVGMDWVCVDMEHGHLDFGDVIEHLRAAAGTELSVVVRVSDIHRDLVKRALDMGADGVLLPLVRSAADVARGFRYGRYPPRGERGFGGERAVLWGLGVQEYLEIADQETLIIPIIETREAVEDIEAILATPGLEAIFFGPADLSASYGYLGHWEGPGVADTILRVRALADARGVAAGVMGRSLDEGRARLSQGFRMVGVGSDAGLLIEGLTSRMRGLRG